MKGTLPRFRNFTGLYGHSERGKMGRIYEILARAIILGGDRADHPQRATAGG